MQPTIHQSIQSCQYRLLVDQMTCGSLAVDHATSSGASADSVSAELFAAVRITTQSNKAMVYTTEHTLSLSTPLKRLD